ncbi:unnamed protein product, partial [Musa textilis]
NRCKPNFYSGSIIRPTSTPDSSLLEATNFPRVVFLPTSEDKLSFTTLLQE